MTSEWQYSKSGTLIRHTGGEAREWSIGYPIPALLYDAKRGNTYSRRKILHLVAMLHHSGDPVPGDIAKFLAMQFMEVMDGQQKAAAMFNPEGTKVKSYSGRPADIVDGFDLDGDIKARFKKAGEILSKKAGTVEREYYEHRDYKERINRIQELLDEGHAASDIKRKKAIIAELQRLTSIVS